MKRIARDDISVWRDFLPDIAHLAGCSAATAAAIHILPWPVGSVLIGGIAFTAATYFFQSHLRDTRD